LGVPIRAARRIVISGAISRRHAHASLEDALDMLACSDEAIEREAASGPLSRRIKTKVWRLYAAGRR
jgi:hypothetical protein